MFNKIDIEEEKEGSGLKPTLKIHRKTYKPEAKKIFVKLGLYISREIETYINAECDLTSFSFLPILQEISNPLIFQSIDLSRLTALKDSRIIWQF